MKNLRRDVKERILKEVEEKRKAIKPDKITPASNPLKVDIPKPKKK